MKKIEFDAKISIDRLEQMTMFLQEEGKMLRGMTDKTISIGTNIVFCQKRIGDAALDFLTKVGIFGCKEGKGILFERIGQGHRSWGSHKS